MSKDTVFFMFVLFVTSNIFASVFFSTTTEEAIEDITGNSVENMQNLKLECEKSLPRDKECVMVFDFVAVEADYE
jgi:hypothetical protein